VETENSKGQAEIKEQDEKRFTRNARPPAACGSGRAGHDDLRA